MRAFLCACRSLLLHRKSPQKGHREHREFRNRRRHQRSRFQHRGLSKADPIEKEFATLIADLRSFLRKGEEILASPDDTFWSILWRNTILTRTNASAASEIVQLPKALARRTARTGRKATARSRCRWRMAKKTRNSQEVQHLLAGEKKYKPSSLSAVTKARQSKDLAVPARCSRKTSQPRAHPWRRQDVGIRCHQVVVIA